MARWLVHDLRNPVQAITLTAHAMDEMPPGSLLDARGMIAQSSAHLARTLELLDRAFRPASGAAEAGPIALRETVEFVVALHRLLKTSARLDVTGALRPGIPAVLGIEADLEHALLNLLINALEASPSREETTITLDAEAAGGRVALSILDEGPGVAEEVRDRLFEPFAGGKGRSAAGLGLAVARALVQRSGGTLDHLPGTGRGACFIMSLPVWPTTSRRS